jgi:hypothetical protein
LPNPQPRPARSGIQQCVESWKLVPLIQPIVIAVIMAVAMSESLAATRSGNQDLFEDVIKQFDCDRILESGNGKQWSKECLGGF